MSVDFSKSERKAEAMIKQDMQQSTAGIDISSTPEILKGVGNTAQGMSILANEAISKYR